jgi:hypothetical protein
MGTMGTTGLLQRCLSVVILSSLIAVAGVAQTTPTEQKPADTPKPAATEQKPGTAQPRNLILARAERLKAAKTVFIKNAGGSSIPMDVISGSLEGWGRYTMAAAADKADVIIEISSPEESSSSITVNGSRTSPLTGQPEQSTTTSRSLSTAPIKMTVFDSKTKLPLWTATQPVKGALKQKSREDNLVEAAQTLFLKFHLAVEPPTP